ncbi:hypothetical protein [Siccirubricoccus sp. G192]|uniref:hypothetical protein n=1 Tax=Siccirubricoccus sp. G192 TaxID=2849651 RepID=UPI001C2BDF9A|nr:hypothetical protein [Siccirubricoccus sp. G192]MBV1796279.1 hypothetical protein [Siccirubricoccus sp. G192]
MPLGLARDTLLFEFPEVHPDAVLRVSFQRTLRVPDDAGEYHLPPGLGAFPLRAVDDLPADLLPEDWRRRGGVALPMWQSEACWLSFSSPSGYPMAVKIAAGKVNAITGKPWTNELDFARQDYLEVPGQPWIDGFCVAEGIIRQFVAMPLGQGYTAEEQITGAAEHGGLQLLVHPLKRKVWQKRQRARARAVRGMCMRMSSAAPSMGLAPGGRIRQQISKAKERAEDWDLATRSRCFVHIANSLHWRRITGAEPPSLPPAARDYTRAGLPWFDLYQDAPALPGSPILAGLASVSSLGQAKGEAPLPENEGFEPPEPVLLGLSGPPILHVLCPDQRFPIGPSMLNELFRPRPATPPPPAKTDLD